MILLVGATAAEEANDENDAPYWYNHYGGDVDCASKEVKILLVLGQQHWTQDNQT